MGPSLSLFAAPLGRHRPAFRYLRHPHLKTRGKHNENTPTNAQAHDVLLNAEWRWGGADFIPTARRIRQARVRVCVCTFCANFFAIAKVDSPELLFREMLLVCLCRSVGGG